MKLWIARSEAGYLTLHYHKPSKVCTDYAGKLYYESDYDSISLSEEKDYQEFSEVTFDNSPMEVELVIKR